MKSNDSPFFERLINNIWLLFVLGVLIYFISYIGWGMYEIGSVPKFPDQLKQETLK